ncbi:hypothetical protein KAFR_0C01530 [Kazachstania africana CBS 2517]|uniref:Peptidase S54 rhomboid domain-containing protein n=1 Tax=Kazachstania africana (strain ATCC 22294 / BCRC 22015 / CBS 2517 / CECT 1963 / NBRC 1671 / NRRL Y-8276) TaxID=1071382 RepID=H2ARZ6_KAZAF|nr:hypothetical protein KAFR_0C01530 [Kazachstania africana CBS 2517]CCF57146.1 hypothetical protein KAFR_0C01530 [Kazachstania africana CBS 2517]
MQYSNRFFELSLSDDIFDFRQIPEATKFITGSYVLLTSALYIIRRSLYYQLHPTDPNIDYDSITNPILQLIPSSIIKYPFSIILSNLIDTELWKVIVNLLNLLIGGSFIERNWNSSKEMFKFIFVIGSITNFVVVLVAYLLSFVFTDMRLDVPLDGNYTVIIGFPIIYKQLLPETTIVNITKPKLLSKNFRFKLLPIFVMCIMTLTELIWFHHFAQLLSIWISFFSCWIYLRFYQVLPLSNSRDEEAIVGDASDTFQLIHFFPDIIKPLLKPCFEWCYNFFTGYLHIIRPFQANEVEKGNDIAEQRGANKITDAEERRRKLALQVLEERMV